MSAMTRSGGTASPASSRASRHSRVSVVWPRIAATSRAKWASGGKGERARATRWRHTWWMSSGSTARSSAFSTNPRGPTSRTPRSTQSPMSWMANSGFPWVRSATWPARSSSRSRRAATRARWWRSGRGVMASSVAPSLARRASRRRRSTGRSGRASSRTVARTRIGAAVFRICCAKARASAPHCTSSSHTSTGRSSAARANRRATRTWRSVAWAKRTRPWAAPGLISSARASHSWASSTPWPRTWASARATRSGPARSTARRSRATMRGRPSAAPGVGPWAARRTWALPTSSARWASHSTRRLFPSPAWPRSTSTRLRPARRTSARASHRASRSAARSTSGTARSPNRERPAPTRGTGGAGGSVRAQPSGSGGMVRGLSSVRCRSACASAAGARALDQARASATWVSWSTVASSAGRGTSGKVTCVWWSSVGTKRPSGTVLVLSGGRGGAKRAVAAGASGWAPRRRVRRASVIRSSAYAASAARWNRSRGSFWSRRWIQPCSSAGSGESSGSSGGGRDM
jgi:hypothetical protein